MKRFSLSVSGRYGCFLVLLLLGGCSTPGETPVPLPKALFSYKSADGTTAGLVAPARVEFTNESTDADVIYWKINGTRTDDLNPVILFSEAGTFDATLYAQNNAGDTDSLTSQIVVSRQPDTSNDCILWQQRLGGTKPDYLNGAVATSDGGYLLYGSSESDPSGDKTSESEQFGDLWLVKVNANGEKQWEKMYGGDGVDTPFSAHQLPDGGFLIGGDTNSRPSTSMGVAAPAGSYVYPDYFALRLDASGNKVWQKRFGNGQLEYLSDVLPTRDGGSLMLGSRTYNTPGSDDAYLIKLDTEGNAQWEKNLGGSGFDFLAGGVSLADGGYLLAGGTNSSVYQPSGEQDIWLVRINSKGDILWTRTVGGSRTEHIAQIIPVAGGYLLVGDSNSPVSGKKSQPNLGGSDAWVVKVDESGNKLWDFTYGGSGYDDFAAVSVQSDGSLVFGGTSSSPQGSDHSQPAWNNSADYWVVGTTANGQKQWDKRFGGNNPDVLSGLIRTRDGNFLLTGYSESGATGNKSQSSRGDADYWFLKIRDCR